ncbi:glycosyltransferase [Lentimicrobium saccharophilum]|nr:glycosyltransferase [Lentimicrobium saccharophilum]
MDGGSGCEPGGPKTMRKKKLCLLISTLGPGGMQKAMSLLAQYFTSKEDVEVHLILYGISKKIFFKLPETISIHKPNFDFDNESRFISTIRTLLFIRKEIKLINPDVILSFGEYWNSFVLISLLGFRTPIYISDRCQPDKSLGFFHDKLRKVLYPLAKGIITQTNAARDIYAKMISHSNIAIIGNPIDNRDGNSSSVLRENVVLSVGRLIPSKHHDLLIDIFLKVNMSGWKLVIVGGDVAYSDVKSVLQEKIRNLNAEDRVILAGNSNKVDEFYRKSKIFAFTSSSEGFPNVIGEAMAAGLPVIAYDCLAGPSDMIEDGKNGFLIPMFDDNLFVEKLSELMGNEGMQAEMGVNSRLMISRYSIERVGMQYYEFLFG